MCSGRLGGSFNTPSTLRCRLDGVTDDANFDRARASSVELLLREASRRTTIAKHTGGILGLGEEEKDRIGLFHELAS